MIKVDFVHKKEIWDLILAKTTSPRKSHSRYLVWGILEHNEIHPDQGVVFVPILEALNIDSGLGKLQFSW